MKKMADIVWDVEQDDPILEDFSAFNVLVSDYNADEESHGEVFSQIEETVRESPRGTVFRITVEKLT